MASKTNIKKQPKPESEPDPKKRQVWKEKIAELNTTYPWLKVVLLAIFLAVMVAGLSIIIKNSVQQAETVQEPSMSEEQPSDEPAQAEGTGGEAESTAQSEAALEVKLEPVAQPEPAPETKPQANPTPSTGRKLVALTFDDGPSAAQTPRLLQILRDKGVKVTFFVLGNMAQKSPGILQQEAADGHEVASHTMTHANLKKATIDGIKWEVAATNEVFVNALGYGPSLTRPPYGNINDNVRTYVNQPLILWTVDPEDWRYRNSATVRRNVVSKVFDGAIVLLHDIHATTVDAVAWIIDDLRAAGYEFMTVSELAAARGVKLQNGVSYGSFRP